MSALDDLTAAVSAVAASIDAAIVVIGNSPGDATQLAALTSQLASAKQKLDAAVAAAAPPPPAP